jgi:YebC/PmpR family DNA-binding regulatory protein
MSGHSKWNNIKNRKAAVDTKKGKVFSQLARNIRLATREGGSGDPKFNAGLRVLLDKARAANMPNEKIKKAIDVGLGKGDASNVKEVVYEAFGPGGVGLLITSFTDNANRTSAELRTILGKFSGSLGAPGSVMYMFKRGEKGDYVCSMPFEINDQSKVNQLNDLIEQLLGHDDVEEVYHSAKLIEHNL